MRHKFMNLVITENDSLQQIREEFNSMYPSLSINFYGYAKWDPVRVKLEKIAPETKVKDLYSFSGRKLIHADGNKTVAQLEKDFHDTLELQIKVFRKSGTVWVGTRYTRNWTLENQNSIGEEIVID